MNAPQTVILIRTISARQTHDLRGRILRPGRPAKASVFPGDDAATTTHFGAALGDAIVGVVTVLRQPMPGQAAEAWQLRGMAVEPGMQGRCIGRRLVAAVTRHVTSCGGGRLWCNARLSAADFYRKLGFDIHGEAFDIPDAGPHYLMSIIVMP